MAVPPIPVNRYLVPDAPPTLPEGFTEVREMILGGLPHRIQLDRERTLTLVLPTGLAAAWRDADPTAVVTASHPEVEPRVPGPAAEIGAVGRAPARLVLRQGGTLLAAVPLAAGLRRVIPTAGTAGASVELYIVEWDLRAGSLRGPGDFRSRIVLGWRRADLAVPVFGPVPVQPQLAKRLPPEDRIESEVGLRRHVALRIRVEKRRQVFR